MKKTTLTKIALLTAQLLGSTVSYASQTPNQVASELLATCQNLNVQWTDCPLKDSPLGEQLRKLAGVCNALADYQETLSKEDIDCEFAFSLSGSKISMRTVLGQIASDFDKQISDAKTYRHLVQVVLTASEKLLSHPSLKQSCTKEDMAPINWTLVSSLTIGALTLVGTFLTWFHYRGQMKRTAAAVGLKVGDIVSHTDSGAKTGASPSLKDAAITTEYAFGGPQETPTKGDHPFIDGNPTARPLNFGDNPANPTPNLSNVMDTLIDTITERFAKLTTHRQDVELDTSSSLHQNYEDGGFEERGSSTHSSDSGPSPLGAFAGRVKRSTPDTQTLIDGINFLSGSKQKRLGRP